MKKSLIALAVAGALVAPAAMADTSNVNVYGEMNVSLDMVKSGEKVGANSGGDVSARQVNSNESRLGFKGSEDLGGGLSAVYQVEYDVMADSGTGATTQRIAFAGLKMDAAGTLALGKQYTPYRQSTRGLDLFADGIADNRSLMGMGHDTALTDTIAFNSASMSGFSVAAAYAMGAEDATTTTDTKGKAISVAAMYDMAPFYATIAHQKMTYGTAGGQFTSPTADSDKAFKVGGSYKTDMFTVNAVIENIESVDAAAPETFKARNIYVAGQYNITSTDAVKLAYTKTGDVKIDGVTEPSTGARQISVGYDHNLSKRTTVYALYTRLDNDTNINNCLTGAGSNGPYCDAAPVVGDASPSAISFGMKHSF